MRPVAVALVAGAILVGCGSPVSGNGQRSSGTTAIGTPVWSVSAVYPKGTDLRGYDMTGVSCTGHGSCAAVGYNSGTSPAVLFSSDGGVTWKLSSSFPATDTSVDLNGISCPSPPECVVIGKTDTAGYIAVTYDGGASWQVQSVPPARSSDATEFDAVSCPTPRQCVAVGSDNSQAGPAIILESVDAGHTWTKGTYPSGLGLDGGYFASIACPTASQCFTGGYSGPAPSGHCGSAGFYGTLLLATSDGGTSWSPVPSFRSAAGECSDVAGISCVTASQCTVVGLGDSGSFIVSTADSGRTWTPGTYPSGLGIGRADTGSLDAVSCTTLSACIATGPGRSGSGPPVVITSIDAGRTWHSGVLPARLSSPGSPVDSNAASVGSFKAVSCDTDGVCDAVGQFGGDAIFVHSDDSGATWHEGDYGRTTGLHGGEIAGLSCADTQHCVAVGSIDNDAGTAHVLQTSDAGHHWQAGFDPPDIGGNATLSGVSCPTTSECVAVGGNDSGSMAISTADGGAHWRTLTLPDSTSGAGDDLNAVSCASAARCVAVGGYREKGTAGGLVVATTDGGAQWTQETLPDALGLNATSYLNGVSCPDSSNCVAVGSGDEGDPQSPSVIITSHDGGAHWGITGVPGGLGLDNGNISAVACASARFCAAVGIGSKPVVIVSTGGVRNWTPARGGVRNPPSGSGDFLSAACVKGGYCTVGRDGGAVGYLAPSFIRQVSLNISGVTALNVNALSCPSASVCYAAGGADGAFIARSG